jgi:diacylglycerol kinase family enzyme
MNASPNDLNTFLAIVNPAAGGGRCGKLAPAALDDLRKRGVSLEVQTTHAAGQGSKIAAQAYRDGYRNFIAVGGDGTSFEIINGLYPLALNSADPSSGLTTDSASSNSRPALGFLPLGTGNSFLKDFNINSAPDAAAALAAGKRRCCDVIHLTHATGELYYINLLTLGFAADVAVVANRHFKFLGPAGYVAAVSICLARLDRRAFPLRTDLDPNLDTRRCLFLAFSNSRYTGGKMLIAPNAVTDDGLIEYVRWGPISRLGLIKNFHTLFDGTHVNNPLASRAGVRRVEFELEGPVNVMIDGESPQLQCQRLEILPSVLDVCV